MVIRFVLSAALFVSAMGSRAWAYALIGAKWPGSTTTMQLQLGTVSSPLIDGFTSWDASAEDALNTWNSNIGALKFAVVRDSTATRAQGNRLNNVFFSSNIYGSAWGNGVLAVTLTFSSGGGSTTTETDVLFNNGLSWNSYRGAQRSSGGVAVYDFHRVAMHEFGHSLGLDHPDEAGQTVSALMNSHISSIDTVTSDDIAGAQSLYGAAATATPTVALPVITSQPANVTVTAGQSASFAIAITSAASVTYQWRKNGTAITGGTNATFSIGSTTAADAGNYTVVVTNTGGSVTSNAASLTINAASTPTTPTTPTTPSTPTATAPSITAQPANQTVAPGSNATFSVTASGTAPLSYQWRKNGFALGGAFNSTLTLANVQSSDAGTYSVVVSNSVGSVTSSSATLTLQSTPATPTAPAVTPPVFTQQPASQTAAAGNSVTFTANATSTVALTYQWYRDDQSLAGATSASLTLANVQAGNAGAYRIVATNSAGSVSSTSAVLTVIAPPRITLASADQTIAAGESLTLKVEATGTPAPGYQWRKDGVDIAGATGTVFLVERSSPTDAGTYSVRVSNAAGAVTSRDIVVAVKFSRLMNLSTRGFVPPGGALTPGFALRGTATKSLVIRGVGPTLSLFGVGTALSDASLELIAADSSVVASNNRWGGTTALNNAFASVGAFPLAADSKDAAVQANLMPQAYTVRIAPTEPSLSGVTLAEVYDADAAPTATRLVNVSTLGFIGAGDNVLAAGFVISGNASKRLLIRAIGPGLAPFSLTGLLADPQLTLQPLGSADPIASNDNWSDNASTRAAFDAAGAFGLTSGSKDAALVITLEPGAYTVIVSGVGAATGNALVEIYDLDP